MRNGLEAKARANVSKESARQWFMELETHPERYEFATHAGFEFIDGNFGEIGAQFQTEEKFIGLRIRLRFELTDVNDDQFNFQVLRPNLPIWGTFSLERVSEHQTNVYLHIGSDRPFGSFVLNFPLISLAIQRQIQREVDHIKSSMEKTDGE
jgi:hypothetical protein